MKRASYTDAVRWIARNDEPEEIEIDYVENMISALLIADLFEKNPTEVAKDIVAERGVLSVKLSEAQLAALEQRAGGWPWDDLNKWKMPIPFFVDSDRFYFHVRHEVDVVNALTEAANAEDDCAEYRLVAGDTDRARQCARSLTAICRKVMAAAKRWRS